MIAMAAVVLSLLTHAFGLSFSGGVRPQGTSEDETTDVVTITNTFEDIVEALDATEPSEPDVAPEPEPEEEVVPEPETAEVPTTEVKVASSNPQKTFAPDTGSARVVRPDATGPADFESGTIPEPVTVQPAGGRDTQISDATTQPVEPDTVAQTPRGTPDTISAPPVEALAAPPAPETSAAPTPEQLAALPPAASPAVPTNPVAPTPKPSAVPVIPVTPETVERDVTEPTEVSPAILVPETPDTSVDPETTDAVEAEDQTSASDQPLTASLRPRLPTQRPPADPEGRTNGTEAAEARTPRSRLIESPLTAYRRDGTDLNILRDGGARSGGLGFQNARGPGNSDVTNYAGRVLVHLNRVPAIRVVGRGWARVFFEINPDGSLGSVGIIESVGPTDIERAARAQIRAAVPFPRPPNGNVRRMSFVYQAN